MAAEIPDITILDFTTWQAVAIKDLVTKASLSWTMDAVSQVTLEIEDPQLTMLNGYLFQVRRPLAYGTEPFEIAAWNVTRSDGGGAKHIIECRRIQIQRMKRDKNPGAISAATPTEYARLAAERFGLWFQGESSAPVATIVQASGDANDESVWSVVQRLASEAGFIVFEASQVLYFASEQWLLGKYAQYGPYFPGLTFSWPQREPVDLFPLIEFPDCRQSDDDPRAAEFTCLVDRTNATQLRPGMTANLIGVNGFNGRYLVVEVSYDDGVDDPVSVRCRTPEKPRDLNGVQQPDTREARS